MKRALTYLLSCLFISSISYSQKEDDFKIFYNPELENVDSLRELYLNSIYERDSLLFESNNPDSMNAKWGITIEDFFGKIEFYEGHFDYTMPTYTFNGHSNMPVYKLDPGIEYNMPELELPKLINRDHMMQIKKKR